MTTDKIKMHSLELKKKVFKQYTYRIYAIEFHTWYNSLKILNGLKAYHKDNKYQIQKYACQMNEKPMNTAHWYLANCKCLE